VAGRHDHAQRVLARQPHLAAIMLAFDADRFEPIQHMIMDWEDLFDVTVYPAISADEGLAHGAKLKAMAA
jgi:hypothetical protein